jgi:hypothetical protein
MKRFEFVCALVMVLNFGVQAFYFEQRTPIKQLPSMALMLLTLILLLVSFILLYWFAGKFYWQCCFGWRN